MGAGASESVLGLEDLNILTGAGRFRGFAIVADGVAVDIDPNENDGFDGPASGALVASPVAAGVDVVLGPKRLSEIFSPSLFCSSAGIWSFSAASASAFARAI